MKQPEALRLADALDELDRQFSRNGLCGDAAAELRRLHEVNQDLLEALHEALETEQEPVAFINVEKQKLEWAKLTSWHTPTIVNLPKIPLYTAPPKQWVGLTDEELKPLCDENPIMFGAYTVDFIQAIEAKLKEKNT
jgi:hypothetical protein